MDAMDVMDSGTGGRGFRSTDPCPLRALFHLLLFLIVAFPYYVWRPRKGAGLLVTLGLAGAFVVLAGLADWAGWMLWVVICGAVGG
jgi:hypothetical protein